MRKDLLEHTDGLRTAKTRTEVICAYSGDEIPRGTQALLVRSHRYSPEKQQIGDKTYSTWISSQYQSELEEALANFDYQSATPREDISPTGFIAYGTSKGSTSACPMCQDQVSKGTEAVVFRNRTNPDREQTVWCHQECISTLCGGLGNIEDYTNEILVNQI